jgi:integrase
MKNTLIDTRKIESGSIKLKQRVNGKNPASLYIEIYNKTTKKQNLQFLNLYLNGSETENAKVMQKARQVFNEYGGELKKKTSGNFTDFFNSQVEKIEKKRSRGMYYSTLAKLQAFAGAKDISFKRIDENFLFEFKKWLTTEAISETSGELLKQNAANNYFSITKTYAAKAKRAGYISPFAFDEDAKELRKIGYKKNPVITFSIEEILKLQSTPYPAMPELPKAFMLQFATLQRWSDIVNMDWNILNNNELFKTISQLKTGKNIPTIVDEKLLKWIAGDKIRVGRIFRGFPKDDQTIREHLREWAKLAGVKYEGIGTHIFRRSGATAMHKQGLDILYISLLLGHSTIEQTKIYIGVDLEDYKRGFELMNREIISKFSYKVA